MRKVTVIVEGGAGKGYSAYMEDNDLPFEVHGTGKTATEAMADFSVAWDEMKEYYGGIGKEFPTDVEYEFKLENTSGKGMNALAQRIHQNAVDKGFYEQPIETGTQLMLIVSEISEALEADRKNSHADLTAFDNPLQETPRTNQHPYAEKFRTHIKDTFEDEIADAIIRLLDLCAYKGIDIERHIDLKMRYNALREYRHGKDY